MTSKPVTRDQFLAWIDATHQARQALDVIFGAGVFLDASSLLVGEGQIELLAELLDYPGDDGWEHSTARFPLIERTEAEQQVQDLAMIVRKLLRHVPDDVTFKSKAADYLVRKGLTGSILRS